MMFTISIHGEPGVFEKLSEEKQHEVMAAHGALNEALGKRGDYVSFKLMPPSTAVTIEPAATAGQAPLIVDGPFAETKESFLGIYAADFTDLEEAISFAKMISSPIARLEVRPVAWAGGALAAG